MALRVTFLWVRGCQLVRSGLVLQLALVTCALIVSTSATYSNYQQHPGPGQDRTQDQQQRTPEDFSFYAGDTGAFYPNGRPQRDPRIRLVDATYDRDRCLGRVELRAEEGAPWSALCADSGWDFRDASVACFALGCGMLRQVLVEAQGEDTPSVAHLNPQCTGVESSLFDCMLDSAGTPVDPLDKDGPQASSCTSSVARLRCAPPCHLWRSDRKYAHRYRRSGYRPFKFHSHTPVCSFPLCGHPGAPINGKVAGRYLNTYGAGTILGFECDAGYMMKGPQWLYCTHAGLWNERKPTCVPIPGQCSPLAQIQNGVMTGSGVRIGSTVTFVCNPGYRLSGAGTLTCVSNDTWSDQPPSCVCSTIKDIAFILDESGSVQPQDFARQVDFVSQFVQQYDIGSTALTQVALIRYGSTVQLEFNFNTYSSRQAIVTALSTIQYSNRGNTNTGGALRIAATEVFVSGGGVRALAPDATRVCVVITDGQSNIGPGVQGQADTLRQLGVRVIAIGVGTATDRQELEVIASMPVAANVFELTAFDQFNTVLQDIRDAACAGGRCCCPDPGTPENGGRVLTNTTSISIGTTVTYSCSAGFVIRGSPSAVCLQGLMWSQPLPVCGVPTCEDPGTPLNAMRSPSGTPSQGFDTGNSVVYTCLEGYQLLGAPTRTCQSFGQWSGEPVSCERVCCGNPGSPQFGARVGGGFCFGDLVSYTCNTGYSLQGDPSQRCQATGIWSSVQPICSPAFGGCAAPCTPLNGIREPPNDLFQVGEVVFYSCDGGYYLSGSGAVSRRCQADGRFTGICPECQRGCSDLGPIANGLRTGNSFGPGDEIRYSCSDGYLLVGQETLTCQSNGVYDSSVPSCAAIQCPDPGLPANSVRNPAGPPFPFRTEIRYTCAAGYRSVGNTLQTCLSSGQWFGSQPTCQFIDVVDGGWSAWTNWTTCTRSCDGGARVRFRFCDSPAPSRGGAFCDGSQLQTENCNEHPCVTCRTPPAPLAGRRSSSGPFEPGSRVSFICETGYLLSGGAVWTCQGNGNWQPDVVACDLVSCGFPGAPDNGRITGTQFTFNRTVTYDCNRGYELDGGSVRRCQADRAWTGDLPSCIPTLCPIPDAPVNGGRTSNGPFLVDSSVTFFCEPTYIFQGTQTWVCLPSGDWSASQARCEMLERCDSPGIPDNGFLSTTVWPEGTTVAYTCRSGFQVVGGATRTCQRAANNQLSWTGVLPTCLDGNDKDAAP